MLVVNTQKMVIRRNAAREARYETMSKQEAGRL